MNDVVSAESVPEAPLPESQRRVLDAAVDAFVEAGFSGTATSEIARRAGVAEGTIFRYYKTKKALLIGAVGHLVLRAVTPMMRARLETIMSTEYASFAQLIEALGADRLDFARSHPALLRLVAQEVAFHPELREAFRSAVVANILPLLTGAIERYQARGAIRDLPPTTVARMVVSMIGGYVLSRVLIAPDDKWDDALELRQIAQVLGKGLLPD